MERTNKMRTTTFTKRVIEAHMLRRSKVGVSCSKNTANTYKVATIRLLLNFQVAAPRAELGDHQECLLIPQLCSGGRHLKIKEQTNGSHLVRICSIFAARDPYF